MGLMDLARGGGEGNNTVNNQGNKRRGGSGMKNNSALVQRYLAAVDGDAIELLLPTSPKTRRQQQQPTSPSGRSRSSHTTKSTKYTVRTAGSDSAVWNEVLTPSSAAPLKSRRSRGQQHVSRNHQESINDRNQQTLSPQELSPASVKHVANSPSTSTSPRRGLFPRSLLRNSSLQQAKATTKPSSSKSPSLIRKWNTDHIKGNGISSSNGSITTSTRPIPSNTKLPPPRSFGKRKDVAKYHQPSDDDDSSLTSRHTTESKESPYRDSRRSRSSHREEDDYDDNDEETTSSYDEDEESTSTGNYGVPQHPQRHKMQNNKGKIGPVNQFSIEKSFDEAVEKGLDMILNTNAWTCNVPQSHQHHPQVRPPQPRPSASTPSIPHSTRDTQQMRTTIPTGPNPVATTPPAHQRRKQRHDEALLRHTLSADTPLSDVTGAATEIATNRAIDLAMKRIRNIEYNNNNTSDPPTTTYPNIPLLDPPESQAAMSSNTTAPSRVKQVVKKFEPPNINDAATATPLDVRDRTNSLNRRTYENIVRKNTISNSGRLGQHFHEIASKHYTQQTQIGENSVESLKSISSVGVEIDDRASRIPVSSTLRAYSDVKSAVTLPVTTEGLSNDWMKVPLPYGPENSNGPKDPAARPFPSRRTQTVQDTIPSTPVSSRYKLPMPSNLRYKTVDPCMSPPQIVRKSHSYDQVSPDPIFCSKSMSMSINSSTMLFSPQQSSNASVEASFQSDDAMFMEKLDESVSTVISNSQKSVEVAYSGSRARTLDLSSSSKYLRPKSKEVSGHTETTCDIHTDEEGTNSIDNERYSPYMEILGIRGRFPTGPIDANRDITTPQQLQHFSSPQVCESRLVPLVPFDSPSPPPIIDDVLSLSREYHDNSGFNSDQNTSKFDESSATPQNATYERKTVFHIAVTKPEPIRSRPNQFVGVGMKNLSTKYSGNSALATKLSRTAASTDKDDIEVRSVDVKSIRSAFESIIGSRDANIENDDDENDDDVASVRSLRERFEPPPIVLPAENRISKARAIFERNPTKSKNRPDIAPNSHAGRILDRRVHRIDVNHRQQECVLYPSDNLKEETDENGKDLNVNTENTLFERKPFTVADRVRAFSGQNRGTKLYSNNKYGPRETTSLSMLPEPTISPPTELSVAAKRSPRNRMSTLRALGGKAFKCGPSKEASDSFDFDGIANITSDSNDLLLGMQEDSNYQPKSNLESKNEEATQSHVPSPDINRSDAREIDSGRAPHELTTHRIPTGLPTVKYSGPHSSSGVKPLWMEQREKILSRSRNSSRVATAACESKRETALISAIAENEIGNCTVEKDIVFVGDVRHTSLKGKDTENDPYTGSSNPSNELVDMKLATLSSRETIDKYNIHHQPEYQLRRTVSENPKPAYKLRRTTSENVKPMENEYSNQLLPFCLQSPVSNEEYVSTNHIKSSDDPTIPLNELYDEKKEEDEYEGIQLSESSKATAESNINVDDVPDIVHYKQNHESQETRPMVIRPVARKPYVRPVPMKPVIESIPVIPFGRSISDPTTATTAHLPTKLAKGSSQVSDANSRFVPRALIDKQYATLELPHLVEGILEPVTMEDIVDSASESSEFSDGVTLDLSIADVSNLTNPTALISKIEGHQCEEDQTRSEISSDERRPDNRHLTRNKRDNGCDAKQSEASSSQTSEAAAPLLARALRAFPLSDEISTDSFFRTRAIAAKEQWNTISRSNRSVPSYALFEENSKDDDSRFGSDLDGIWDIRQVESLFPTTSTVHSKIKEKIHGSSTSGVWQPFPLYSESSESPKAVTGNVSEHNVNNSAQNDAAATTATPSRSKTPTRRNTSRSVQVPPLNATVLLPTFHDEIPQTRPNISYKLSSTSGLDELHQESYSSRVGAAKHFPVESEASYPVLSTTSSNVSGKTNRTIVSNLLSSSMSGAATFSDVYSMKRSTTSTLPVSNKSTASTSTVSTYGPTHSALLARIHALKESRLRRATRMAPYTASRRPSTALAYQGSDQQSYY